MGSTNRTITFQASLSIKHDLISKRTNAARRLWLMPVILTTQEAEIRRITVRSQPGQIDLISKELITKRAGGVAQAVKSTCLASVRP
jgi:hypothetical protein